MIFAGRFISNFQPGRNAGHFAFAHAGYYTGHKDLKLDKTDCACTLTQQLTAANIATAMAMDRIISSIETDNIQDGFWAIILPYFDPVTPKFINTLQTLNNSIITGTAVAADFTAYVKLLAAALQA